MAFIRKRGKKFSVIYRIKDENGKERQTSETFSTQKDAERRQKEIEYKNGVKKEKVKKMFPGYVLVEMVMSDEAWYIVRNTQGVTGFIGSSGKGAKPIPLLPQEVDRILNSMGMSRVDISKDLTEGKKVKIIAGPFKDMMAKIDSVDLKEQKLNVLVDLFGQETSVEVDMQEVETV